MLILYEIIDDPDNDKLFIVTDLVKEGSLAQKLSKKSLNESDIRNYFRGLIKAIDYCHNYASFIHRDIKPENILVGENDQVKLADFGVSQMFENGDDMVTTKAGTNFYFSPEVCKGASYSGMAADVWACGVVLYKMATKKLPFTKASDNLQELFNIILTQEPDYQEFAQYDPKLLDLIKGIFIKDFKQRLTVAQIKVHPWVTLNGTMPLDTTKQQKIVINQGDLKSVVSKIVSMNRMVKKMKL